jgi:hypothetical protein
LDRTLSFAKAASGAKSLICQVGSGENLSLMITLVLHALRLLLFLRGGHRQPALENLAWRHQLAVYQRRARRPKLRTTDRLFSLASVWDGVEAAPRKAQQIVDAFPNETAPSYLLRDRDPVRGAR